MPELNSPADPKLARVLDGVRVLDFSAIIAGAYCTRMLADLGADVLKVEPPSGDLMRSVSPLRDGSSTVFSALNAGKRSLVLDLKHAAAVDLCKRLVSDYDVVVENFSPGVMQRFGLDYATLSALNPRLIMCSISGYGQDGPGANRPAFAPIVHAMSGFDQIVLNNQAGQERPLNMGLPVADTTAGLQAFGALNAALYYRARTNIGQFIDIAMLDSLLSTMHRDFQVAFHPLAKDRTYSPLATADGFVMATPISPSQFAGLTRCIARPDLLDDARFRDTRARFDNYNELLAITESWTTTRTSALVVSAMETAGVPCVAYRSVAEAAMDPQLAHRGMLTEITDPAGPLTVVNSPFHFSATTAAIGVEVAALGAHTYAVLEHELGLSAGEIATLAADGVINSR
jgi:CoA:oxalate CoA-transferase